MFRLTYSITNLAFSHRFNNVTFLSNGYDLAIKMLIVQTRIKCSSNYRYSLIIK